MPTRARVASKLALSRAILFTASFTNIATLILIQLLILKNKKVSCFFKTRHQNTTFLFPDANQIVASFSRYPNLLWNMTSSRVFLAKENLFKDLKILSACRKFSLILLL